MPVELRASRLPLLMNCAGPGYLPTEDEDHEERDKGIEWGKLVHKWKETGEIDFTNRRLGRALQTAIFESGVERLSLWPPGGVHEQPVSLRVSGVREVLASAEPNAGWITGTDDFQYWMLDDTLWIDDLKTGKYYPDPETGGNRYPQDVRSPQLRFYALGISLLLNYGGRVNVSLTHWPRLPLEYRHSKPERFWTEYTHEELLEFYGQLEKLYERIRAGNTGDFSSLSPGPHCRFCPGRNNCLVAEEPEIFQIRKYR